MKKNFNVKKMTEKQLMMLVLLVTSIVQRKNYTLYKVLKECRFSIVIGSEVPFVQINFLKA